MEAVGRGSSRNSEIVKNSNKQVLRARFNTKCSQAAPLYHLYPPLVLASHSTEVAKPSLIHCQLHLTLFSIVFICSQLQDLLFSQVLEAKISEEEDWPLDPNSVVFICNKWDEIPLTEHEDVKQYTYEKLHECWTPFKKSQTFFLSAKDVSRPGIIS